MADIPSISLKKILKKSRRLENECVVYRGSLETTEKKSEILLRPHLSLHREWAVFRTKDLVGKPVRIPVEQCARREKGRDIFEISVRKGARMRHVEEWLYRVGKFAPPRGIEDHFIDESAELREEMQARVSGFLQSLSPRSPYAALGHGLILKGITKGEFTLQPDPGDRRQWVSIRIADVVGPDALVRIPSELLPARLHRYDLHFVPLRKGAIVRTMWDKERVVSVPPQYAPTDGSKRRGPAPIAAQGDCSEGAGKCPPAIGGSGYPCSSASAFCRHFGIFPCSGTCTTVASSWWTCRCDCC